MKRFGHIVAVLAFAFALVMGAAGGAMAHAGPDHGAMDHHGSHHAPAPPHGDSHGDPNRAALTVVAPCCPAAEAPAGSIVTVAVTMARAVWHPRPEYTPGARDIAPEPPPPKTSL
ncbi:hypothetical protein [Azospirillum sp.]|uniref:hypothetical protein n=1 Tax=Azospirillum sp. TaxID=34012 RepID=UPI002D2FD323|nr:hypothetical protein [Azospirillum sp.]HYD71461.1 hypothetical protein [Azospirillum sp.]